MADPKYGDRVRVQCGATGRYITDGWALIVSAQDNAPFIDHVKVDGDPPATNLPIPSDDALAGAFTALTNPRIWAKARSERG